MNYNVDMIKKLITTKKSLPISPYQHFPEFKGQLTKFKEEPHNLLDAFMVNVPGNNKDEPGTLKIMFDGRDGFYDLENNKFSGLPEGWEEISRCGGIEGPLKFRYNYGGPWNFSFFPADKYMQMLCSNCGIKNAEKKFSQLLSKRIWNDFCNFKDSTSNLSHPFHQNWKRFERKCQKEYQKVTKLAAYYAEKYQKTGKPQHCPDLPQHETALEECINQIKKWGY